MLKTYMVLSVLSSSVSKHLFGIVFNNKSDLNGHPIDIHFLGSLILC